MPRSFGVVFLVALTVWAMLGMFVGRALATHVACGDVITQDTTLDSDLIACQRDGLAIGADDVVVDLGGHTIEGTGTAFFGRSGIVNTAGHDRVTVRNGHIVGFRFGINLSGVTENVFRGLAFSRQDTAIRATGSDRNHIEENRMSAVGAGVIITDANGNRIEHNAISEGTSYGIVLSGGSGNLIRGNSIAQTASFAIDHGEAAIVVRGAGGSRTGNRISRNVVSGAMAAVRIQGTAGATVTQNSVTASYYPLLLEGAVGSVIERNLMAANTYTAVLRDSNENVIVENRAFKNLFGISLYRSNANRMEGNAVADTAFGGGYGFQISASNDNLVKENRLSNHPSDGIALGRGRGNRLVGNRISNSRIGIGLFSETEAEIGGNSISGSDDYGIFLTGSDNAITHNTVRSSTRGIRFQQAIRNRIERNRFVRNLHGLVVDDGEDNLISANYVLRSAGDGIFVAQASKHTRLERNIAKRNGDDGIDVEDASAVVSANTLIANRDLGIEAVVGVLDGGRNKASGNGNSLQCVNVFCR